MEIGALSSAALSNVNVNSQIGVAVLKMAMNTDDTTGNAMQKILDSAAMERSVNPSVGSNFDQYI